MPPRTTCYWHTAWSRCGIQGDAQGRLHHETSHNYDMLTPPGTNGCAWQVPERLQRNRRAYVTRLCCDTAVEGKYGRQHTCTAQGCEARKSSILMASAPGSGSRLVLPLKTQLSSTKELFFRTSAIGPSVPFMF